MIRTLILFLLLGAAAASTASAQSLDAFKERLSAPTTSARGTARVTVVEQPGAARAIAQATRDSQRTRVRGYRVCIFFDNSQNARAGALAAKELFESNYPGIRVHMVYENPYFRVTVGNCLTIEEAIILKGRISAAFPKAFPKSEEFAVSDVLE